MTSTQPSSATVMLPPAHTDSARFPSYVPISGRPDFATFVAGMRTLQDLVSSVAPDEATWRSATAHLDALTTLLQPHRAGEGEPPAGRAIDLPGMGNPLLPPFRITAAGPEGTTVEGRFSRYYLGANGIVLGGVVPLLFDWLLAVTTTAAGRPLSRTAYLNVEYRAPISIDMDLIAHGEVTSVDGRKSHTAANIVAADGHTVLAEAKSLMIALSAHHR
ncbi:PaaI family thioesterase [Mycobacterium sp. 1465703.0]|uniref:PaaI family thioesterase n=1 Tax=Mycobacterium sp. 1465703.0 TaxID=1834078 RepID=UPI000ADF790F|nr:PaaI family thioesterase [Mycobacterium sp. 1465703.0]